ncbi:SGNH/GDSL hydrolase family protein [Heyndrickxia oleronia]|uniref:SGNH/GDSL hydrolase family protein n=1 Tax=Heyndrickxia oleronia TaxID=38875 RepID=A0AAW6SY45_9BACI|nr:SGNH/GDSL hydrolase family protein [Heyndrickxia oleronia]MDH5163233.1 SGNH/GDSL hydrolase family protein [Heyndrickxia oleronia]
MKIGLIGDSLTEGRPGVSFYKILKVKYPNEIFIYLGKPGETVKSLYNRLSKTTLDTDFDLIFLWIGVNDVYSKLLKVQAQPVSNNREEFKDYYKRIIEWIKAYSKKVIVVTPALVGEKMDSPSNMEIKELAKMIDLIASSYMDISVLDMQQIFSKHLANLACSDYISTNVMTIMKDALFVKKIPRIDKLSKERGLYFTLDGVHMNSKGAEIVADAYSSVIDLIVSNQTIAVQ